MFYREIAAGTLERTSPALCVAALLLAGLISYGLFYYIPALIGMRTGYPLYVIGSSTFGAQGGYLMPGILMGLLIAFMITYFVAIELNSATSSTAEMLVFQRGKVPESIAKAADPEVSDPEKGTAKERQQEASVGAIEPQKSIFTWRDVHYDVKIKDETRTLLDNVSGWVKPGTLTALMGVSGAGKTTLLDVLAQRTTMGVITGDMFVNGKPLDASFQRSTGYVQQQGMIPMPSF